MDWQLWALLSMLVVGCVLTVAFSWWLYTRCEVGNDGEYVRRGRTVGGIWGAFMRTLRT